MISPSLLLLLLLGVSGGGANKQAFAAEPVPLPKQPWAKGLRKDIEFAKVGDVSLTLDAFVPEGKGPFLACILVHGGGFMRGDKQTYITPLFEPLSKAGFAWFTINYRLA